MALFVARTVARACRVRARRMRTALLSGTALAPWHGYCIAADHPATLTGCVDGVAIDNVNSKRSLSGLIVASLALASAPTSASATYVSVTYTGTVTSDSDLTGIFGSQRNQ